MSGKGPRSLRSSPRYSWIVCLSLCISSVACSQVATKEPNATSMSDLVGGSLSPVERDAVVFIRANHEDGAFDDCTGTLLSPRVLITAKHCVTLVQPGEFVCTGAGALRVDGKGAGLFGAKFDGSQIEVFPGTAPVGAAVAHAAAIFVSESSDACHDDVAAVVLDTPIAQEYYPPLRLTRTTMIGETVRLVGYGTSEHDQLIERREIADVRVVDVGRDDGVPNPNATTPPRSFVVGGATACFGDSGGPALSMTTGALIGVYSRITGDCFALESRNTYMLASSFLDLFSPAFELAGEEPLLEPAIEGTASNPMSTGGAGGAPVVDANVTAADRGGATADVAGAGGMTLYGTGVGPVGLGGMSVVGAGGAIVVATTVMGGATAGVGGSRGLSLAGSGGMMLEPPVSSRHQALTCSLRAYGFGGSPVDAFGWLLVVAVGRFSRRRRARRPCEDG